MTEEREHYGVAKRAAEVVKIGREELVPLTSEQIKEQVQIIQRVMSDVMKTGTHYDKIQGCGDKPVLLKPGAEKILATFRIGTDIQIEDLGDGYDFRYRILIRGFYIPTGNTIGYGVGECSSKEKKYAWRRAVCKAEFDATSETRKRISWKPKKDAKGYNVRGEAEEELQVRQDPNDIANTVLKMAKKRAMVDLCLTATACSDIFEQDLDEDGIREAVGVQQQSQGPRYQHAAPKQQPQGAPKQSPPPAQQQAPRTGRPITEGQRKRLYAIQKGESGQSDDFVRSEIERIWGYTSSKDILDTDYDAIIAWLQRGCQEEPAQGGGEGRQYGPEDRPGNDLEFGGQP